MQLPRRNKIREELSSMGLLYVLVIVMIVLAFFLRSPIAGTFSLESIETTERTVQSPFANNQDQ